MGLRFVEPAAQAYAFPLLVKHMLNAPMAFAAGQEIVYRDSVRLTYRDLRRRIGQLASALESLGVGEGSTVAMLDWDSHRYLETFFAVPMMGAVLMTVNVRLAPEQILYTMAHARSEVAIVHADFAYLVPRLLAEVPTLRHIVWIADGAEVQRPAELPEAVPEYEGFIAAGAPLFVFRDFDENAMATTFYTTGTTGLPKAVAFSHRQLVLLALAEMAGYASAASGQCFRQGDVYMPITPMFHVHAWGLPFVATMLGVKQVYPGRYEPKLLLRLRAREGVSYSHCVPTLLDMLLRDPLAAEVDLTGWRMTLGGAALAEGLAAEAVARGMDVFCGFGMSETCAGTLITRLMPSLGDLLPQRAVELRCKAGLPHPLVDVRIVDEAMNDLPHDDTSIGELVVRTPWAVQGYVGNPEASEALWQGGYLHTQDLARIDSNGYVTIVDRLKDVIKSGGEWVSSLELESLIRQVPGVRDVAVIGVPDDKWGERPLVLYAVLGDTQADLEARIVAHLKDEVARGRLSPFSVPRLLRKVEELPRTSVGKLDKKALRQQFAG